MVRIIHEDVIIKPGGLIEIRRSDLPEGATARVTVQVQSPDQQTAPPLASLFGSCRGMFKSAEEVDAYIRELRDEWDRPWYPKD